MPQPNDLSRSLVALDQDSTIIAVVEMSQSSWLVAGVLAVARAGIRRICGPFGVKRTRSPIHPSHAGLEAAATWAIEIGTLTYGTCAPSSITSSIGSLDRRGFIIDTTATRGGCAR
jgi:hypothetical protein